jgi:hypothetical protein
MKSTRRGLAPLELVLCLPVLLFVLALIVDTGSKSCWKLRGVVTARDAAWRTRWERTAGNVGNPRFWPPPAVMSVAPTGPNARLTTPQLDHPVVRGPRLGTLLVERELLDPTRGGWVGASSRPWTPPLLNKLGTEPMDQEHPLVATKWQHAQMGIPVTVWRRIPSLYTLPQADPTLKAAFLAAVDAIASAPFRRDLDVLDRDEEILAWYGHYHDFHPRVAFCDEERLRVAAGPHAALLRAIQGGLTTQRPKNGVPGNLARFWIRMYSDQRAQLSARIERIQAGVEEGSVPELTSQVAALTALIEALQAYLNAMP